MATASEEYGESLVVTHLYCHVPWIVPPDVTLIVHVCAGGYSKP